MVYEIFQGWFNLKINKFEFGTIPWVLRLGEMHSLHDFLEEVTHDLVVEETNDS